MPSGRRRAPVPFATPIDSIFNTQSTEMSRSNSVVEKIKTTKTTRTSSNRNAEQTLPNIPTTWEQLRRASVANQATNNVNSRKTVSGNQRLQNELNNNDISGTSFVRMNSDLNSDIKTLPVNGMNTDLLMETNTNLNTNNELAPLSNGVDLSNSVPNSDLLILTSGANSNNDMTLNSPASGNIETLNDATNINSVNYINAGPENLQQIIVNEIKPDSGLNQMPIAESQTTSIQQKSKSVTGDKLKSSASSVQETADGIKASVADATLEKLAANETNVNQTNTKNITITKVGDHHKIQQTEIVETVVDVKKNATETKSAVAASKVISDANGHGDQVGSHVHDHGVHSEAGSQGATNTVSANAGAAEKATAEKKAQVVKKTKKTTTILLKAGSETKSGKAEISEIQHTVEELVHHNTSEKAGAETAATANVDAKTVADPHAAHDHAHHHHAHAHSHAHDVPPVKTEKTAIAEAKKETNSTSTSVKTKSVKQTVIKKKVPDPNTPVSNSTSHTKGTTGTAADPAAGFDVQHVEHVVQETEHTVQQDKSQISKHKSKSSAEPSHNHHHH